MRKIFIYFIVLFSFMSLSVSGQTWSSLKRFTWNAGNSWRPFIAADSGNGIHVVWQDETPGNWEIFYKRSSDLGATWSGLKRMSWNAEYSITPSMTADSGSGIHVVWSDYTPGNEELFYKRSTDKGSTWSALKRLTWSLGGSVDPSIVSDSGNWIHVIWADSKTGNYEIYYKRSSDGGSNWSALSRLTWNAGGSFHPSIAAGPSNLIHFVWADETLGNSDIFYKRSTDSGATWSGLNRLSWNTGWSYEPSLATDSGSGIHVVWRDDTPGNYQIFYKSSSDNGITWSGLKRLTWNWGGSYSPAMVLDSGSEIHVVWHDYTPLNYEIFFRSSTDSGVNWSALTRLTWNAGVSKYPIVAADSTNGIHVVWQDDTPGNNEIFYKNHK